jgi:hypothetical protein
MCDKRLLLERGLRAAIYVEITINKQLMHTFLLNFVVSLQSRFYTLALIFVFDVNLYSILLQVV